MHAQILPPAIEPADDREELVRYDLADTAIAMSLRCVATVIETASNRDAWKMIAEDFASARIYRGSGGNRVLLTAAEEAADHLADDRLDRALERLARGCDSVEEWMGDVRAAKAASR